MATAEELKKIAHKCIDDSDFNTKLEKDPVHAAASIGITLSSEQPQRIKSNAVKASEAGSRESKESIIVVIHHILL